jgi:hypothetical protein
MLGVLAAAGTDRRLGGGRDYLIPAVKAACPATGQPTDRQIQEAIWSLIARGLAYVNISQPAPENWTLELTTSGSAALRDEEINPDDPSGYYRRLYSDIPTLSSLARLYITEAVNSYYHQCYLGSTVMLGVAAEAIFIELAEAFCGWLDDTSGGNLGKILADPKKTHFQKFDEFRKRLLPVASELPNGLGDGLDLQLNSVLDLLRVNRNHAGHPTGVKVSREDSFVHLRIFARIANRIYALKQHFENTKRAAS